MLDSILKQGLKLLPPYRLVWFTWRPSSVLVNRFIKIQPIFDSHRRSNEDESSSQVLGVVCIVIVQKERDANIFLRKQY
jgi:hypothetical protein